MTPRMTIVGAMELASWVACAEASVLGLLLASGLVRLRGTTLMAPCVWAIVSIVSLAIVAVVVGNQGEEAGGIGLSALHFAAAATTLCPLMAVLGAKRPQNHAWQWVVLTLWIVVVWPAAQAVLAPTGLRVELFIAWKLFLMGLVVVGLLNYLPTRFGLAAWLVAAGQVALLDNYLWQWGVAVPQWTLAVGLGCFLAAAVIMSALPPKNGGQAEPENGTPLTEFDRSWKAFRDAYGALWALRILARVNQTAEFSDWPMRLTWSGFSMLDTEEIAQPSAEQLDQLRQTIATLLRRFF